MCVGGVVNRTEFTLDISDAETVYNKVVDQVLIHANGSAPKTYSEVCTVRIFSYFQCHSYNFLAVTAALEVQMLVCVCVRPSVRLPCYSCTDF